MRVSFHIIRVINKGLSKNSDYSRAFCLLEAVYGGTSTAMPSTVVFPSSLLGIEAGATDLHVTGSVKVGRDGRLSVFVESISTRKAA